MQTRNKSMICGKCGAENREGSNFCRYCSAPLTPQAQGSQSGYIPSVPPQPMARPVVPAKVCVRCNSTSVVKGTVPLWAVLVAVIGAPFTCLLSLLFLLVKDP